MDGLLKLAEAIPVSQTNSAIDALVPLAALALQCADAIPGLAELLAAHGWTDGRFRDDVHLGLLKHDLLALNESPKGRWDHRRPIRSWADLVDNMHAWRWVSPGRKSNILTHHAQIALLDLARQGEDTELFKAGLVRGGWNVHHYAFLQPPDTAKLLQVFGSATRILQAGGSMRAALPSADDLTGF